MSPTAAARRAMPRSVTVEIVTLTFLAAGAAGACAVLLDGAVNPPLVPAFLVLLSMAAAMILRFHYGDNAMALEPFEAVMIPAVFALPGSYAVALTAIAQAAANLYRRNHPTKAAFNVAQWSAVAGLAALTLGGLQRTSSLSPIAALCVAIAVAAVTNICALCFVIHLAEREGLRRVTRRLAPTLAVGWLINGAFGLLFVFSYRGNHAAIAFFPLPLALLYWSYRNYAAASADRARLGRMHEAVRALGAHLDPRDAIPLFLEKVRECFDAQAVELALVQQGGRVVHRSGAAGHGARVEVDEIGSTAAMFIGYGEPVRVVVAGADADLRARLEQEGHKECLAAPFEVDGIRGVLCAYDRSGPEGWEEGELAVLAALARELGGALRKGALLAEIMAEREKLSQVVEHTSDGILALDPSGRILVWNPGLERITGYSRDEMVGARAIARVRPRDEAGRPVRLERWTDGDGAMPQAIEIATRAGERRTLSCSCATVTDALRRPTLLVVVARDVTESREIERLRDDFVATVSHELRTPLTPILGWAETLLASGSRLTQEERDEAVRSIRRQAQRLERLIVNLLEVSKIERGLVGRQRETVDARALAERVVAEFRAAQPTRAFHVEAHEVPCPARGEDVIAGQILTNLLSNAVKYSPHDEPITVRVAARGGRVAISVVDRGPGIPASHQDLVFERFRRLGEPLRRAQGGAGLGLYIARQLAKALGGSLELHSALGAGSTFTLNLPAAEELASVG